MEGLIAGLGVAAGAGWGVAGGLAIALAVALGAFTRRPPPARDAVLPLPLQPHEVEVEYPFGRRA